MDKKLTASQGKITFALYKLLLRQNVNDITVKEICRNAGVSRMSFYRSFSSIDDIFVVYCDARFEEFFDNFLKLEQPTGYDFILELFKYMRRYDRQIQILEKAKKSSFLIDKFYQYLSFIISKLDAKETQIVKSNPVAVSFIAGGFYKVYIDWVGHAFDKTPEEMANSLVDLVEF